MSFVSLVNQIPSLEQANRLRFPLPPVCNDQDFRKNGCIEDIIGTVWQVAAILPLSVNFTRG
jgi:hypothetical protein